MGNGELKWEGKVVRVLLELAQLDFFGDGLMWASAAIGQLNMEGKSIFFALLFFLLLNHGKNITKSLLIVMQRK